MLPLNPLTPKNNLTTNVGRAQNFSISKLNYKKDIDNAKVSVGQLARNNRPAVTSVGHINEQLKPNSIYDADADDRRYNYVRGLAMANRQKREAAEAGSVYETGIKTGALYKTTGVTGLRRQLIRMRYEKPGAFRNLSSKDRKYFEDLTEKYVKGVSAGVGISHHARRAMKQQILRDRRKGVVNVEDAKDFYNMIDKLPGVKRGLL